MHFSEDSSLLPIQSLHFLVCLNPTCIKYRDMCIKETGGNLSMLPKIFRGPPADRMLLRADLDDAALAAMVNAHVLGAYLVVLVLAHEDFCHEMQRSLWRGVADSAAMVPAISNLGLRILCRHLLENVDTVENAADLLAVVT